VRPAPEPPAETVIWTSLLVDWKFLAAWSTSGWSADEPAIVSLPDIAAPGFGAAAVVAAPPAAGALVGLVEVVEVAVQAARTAATSSVAGAIQLLLAPNIHFSLLVLRRYCAGAYVNRTLTAAEQLVFAWLEA